MSNEIHLSQGLVAIVDDADAHVPPGARSAYAVRQETIGAGKQRPVRLHRVIARRMGLAIDGKHVDHKNRNGLDCRRENLRVATMSQNKCNMPAPRSNASGFKGVHFDKRTGRWVAQIGIGGRREWLGYHDTPIQAHAAYVARAKELHGEFICTNTQETRQ